MPPPPADTAAAAAAASSKMVGEVPGLLALVAPSEEAAAAAVGAARPAEALALLEGAGFPLEAARLAAHALPRREAVWWACMCARHTAPPDAPPALAALCDAAEAWVRRPTDELRRAAMALAQAGGFDTPEAWCAVAAFWAGDSMAPPDLPKVPPAPHLTGTAVAGAVTLAAVRRDPLRRDVRLRAFLASVREIAGGGAGRLPPGEG